MPESRPPFPPFTRDTAVQKVRAAEDAWNSCNPERVSLAYTPDCYWRNRSEFICGGAEIVAFLKRKWTKELDYRLIKELWAFTESRIAVRFAYEWRADIFYRRPRGAGAAAAGGPDGFTLQKLMPARACTHSWKVLNSQSQ
jgi:nuclear transport factor 2 (NTF2) superfamily protein